MSKICQKVTCWTPSVSLSFSLFFLSFVLCKNHLENGKEILRGSQGGQRGRSEGDSLEESRAGCALERNGGWTAIRGACENGHDSIVSILLAHPDIDVTQNDSDGRSVFNYVCASGKTCARQLLMDVTLTFLFFSFSFSFLFLFLFLSLFIFSTTSISRQGDRGQGTWGRSRGRGRGQAQRMMQPVWRVGLSKLVFCWRRKTRMSPVAMASKGVSGDTAAPL